MVIFKKKKKMLDIGEMHKKGLIKSPSTKTQEIKTDSSGFVDLSHQTRPEEIVAKPTETSSNTKASFFGFMDTPEINNSPEQTSSENLRKISTQLSELDNKLYKLEQRVEVIERKTGTGY